MSTEYLKNVGTRQTPSGQRVPGRTDQVVNSAGGFVFKANRWTILDRFLIMGSEGGTYYIGQRKLTLASLKTSMQCLNENGPRVVDRIVEISEGGRAKSNDPALFVLAVAAGCPDPITRVAALEALPKVARIGTHLFHFMDFVKEFRGRGRALNTALKGWYEDMDVELLALQAVKYRQRDGWSHRDILRLVKPKTADPVRNALYAYMVGKVKATHLLHLPELVQATMRAQLAYGDTPEGFEGFMTADIIKHRMPREALPSEMLKDPHTWEMLLPSMPLGALVRNLGKLSSLGLTEMKGVTTLMIIEKLTNGSAVEKSRIHPMQVLQAVMTYGLGAGVKGSLSWVPSAAVLDALNDTFELSFKNVQPTGLRTLIALDVSGSMSSAVHGIPNLSCRAAAAAMSSILIRTEPWTHTVGFTAGTSGSWGSPNLKELPFTKRSTIKEMTDFTARLSFGGTNCALPMLYAIENNLKVDAFHVYTDNEHWAGTIHPFQALQRYREHSGINARLVCWAMASNDFTIADPSDAGMLDVVGLDSGAPNVVNRWLVG